MGLVLTQQFNGECLICGCVPTNDQEPNNPPFPMVWAEGMDVNWGQDVLLCKDCCGVIADLWGRVDAEKHEDVVDELADLKIEHEAITEKYEKQKERLNKVLEGARARKEQLAA